MSHRNNTGGQALMPLDENAWQSPSPSTEWEADTDVMPPEYCKQLLKISRQLREAE